MMLTIRKAFQEEKLLVVKHDSLAKSRWVGPDQVFRCCPTFVMYTIPVPDFKSIYYENLSELLDLPTWSPQFQLESELQQGVAKMQYSQD